MTIVVTAWFGWALVVIFAIPIVGMFLVIVIGVEHLISRFLRFAPGGKGFRKWRRKYFPPKW